MDYPEEQRFSRKNIVTVASVILMTLLPVGGYASPLKVGVVGAANPAVAALGKDNVKQTLVLGKDVFFDQTIVTDGKGSLQLLFLDKSALTVGPNSSLKIDKFVYNPENSSGEMTITSTKGAFRFIGGALSKKNAVKIKTPVSTIGIRGGIAMVDVSPESGATNATFVYGTEMAIENKNGDKQVTTEAGSGMSVLTPTSPPTAPVKVDVAVLSENIKQLESSEGQHGGTTTVPDEKTVNDKITASEEKSGASTEPSSGSEKTSSSSSEGESKSSSSEEKSQESSSGESKSSTSTTSSENKDSSGTPPVQDNATTATPDGAAPLAPISDGGTKPVVGAVDSSMTPQVNPVAIIPPVVTNITETTTQVVTTSNPPPPTTIAPPPITTGTTGTPPPTTTATSTTTTTTEPKPTTTDATTTTSSGSSAGNTVVTAPTVTHKGQYVIKNSAAANKSGNVNAYVELDKFNTALNQESPVAANSPAAMVKNTKADRFDTSSTGRVNGVNYEGISYRSLNDKMHYYQLSKVDYPSEQIAMVVGERLAKASLPASGTDFFNFLPELQQHHSGTTTQLGFFDWNMANSGLLPAETTTIPNASLMGMAVHWSSGTYFSGYMNLDYTSTTDYKHLLKVAFGKVNSVGDGPVFTGRSIDISGSNSAASALNKQYNRVNENIYGSSGNVDGLLIERMNPDSLVAVGTDPFTVAGTVTQQPMMKGNTPSGFSDARTSGTLNGFMAGFMKKDIHGSAIYKRYWHTGVDQLTISKNATTHNIGAIVNLLALDSGPTMVAKFGSAAPSGTPHQVFVSNKVYAIEQGYLTYNGTQVDRVDGVMVGGNIANANLQCTTCTYVDWGVWAAEAKASAATAVDLAHMMPYIAGTVTENMGGILTGNATYSGKVIGNVLDGAVLTHQHGTFDANVYFGNTPQITSFTANLGDQNFRSVTGNITVATTGAATFSHALEQNGGGTLTGTMNGAFFGPAAQDIGGNFEYTTSTTKATGVYLGSKP